MNPQTARVSREESEEHLEPAPGETPIVDTATAAGPAWRLPHLVRPESSWDRFSAAVARLAVAGRNQAIRRWPRLLLVAQRAVYFSRRLVSHLSSRLADGARRGQAILKSRAPKTYDRFTAAVAWSRSMTIRMNEKAKPAIDVGMASLRAGIKNILGQGDLDFAPAHVGWERRRPPLRSYVLVSSVFVFFLVALIWANWAVLDEVTSGEGRVIPSSQIQVVQNLEGGIVKDLLVHEGDVVEKNQVLLNIDNSTFTASLGEMRAKYYGLMAAIARLTAETDAKRKAPEFSPELLAEAPRVAQSEQALYLARQSQLQAQMSVFQQQAQQHEQELAEIKSKASHLQDSISLVKQEIAINRPLVANGVVSKVDQLKLERQLNDLNGDMQAAVLAVPRIESAVREANQRVEETYLAFQSDAQKELAKDETDFKAVADSLFAAKDRVQRTEVRSPVKGIIKQLKVTTIGGVIKPGMDLVDIVPLDDTLLVEAKIRPRDIAFIRPNQEAMIKFTAYDFAIYGGLKAKVERISADAIEDDQARTSKPETYYKVVLRTESNHLGTAQQALPIIPGMIASVDILTGKKSVLDYLLKPILRGREKAMHER